MSRKQFLPSARDFVFGEDQRYAKAVVLGDQCPIDSKVELFAFIPFAPLLALMTRHEERNLKSSVLAGRKAVRNNRVQ